MNIIPCFKHIEPLSRDGVRDYLATLSEQHLEKHLASLGQNPVLHVTLEKETHHGSYRVGMRLALGSRNLVVNEQDYDLIAALDSAAETLEWRVRRYLGKRRARRVIDKRAHHVRWHDLQRSIDRQQSPARRRFADAVLPQLSTLASLVQRELAYLQAEDRLSQDYPTITDVLDETLVRALESPLTDSSPDAVIPWLNRFAIDVLARYVDDYRARQLESVSLDEPACTATIDLDPTDDGWLDESLRLDELLPARSDSSAFDAISRGQTQRQALVAMRGLPTRWRRAVSFYYFDEMPPEAIAKALGTSPDEVESLLDASLKFLRERLVEQGIEPVDAGWPADYLVTPPASPQAQRVARELNALVQSAGEVA